MTKKKTEAGRWKGDWIVRNLAWGAVFVAVIVLGSGIALRIATQHNVTSTVPDFTGRRVADAVLAAEKAGIRIEVVDSVYVHGMRKGVVFSQSPKAGSRVKRGRVIELTTNAINEKQVAMPLLVGYSLRQAMVELSSRGLNLGKLTYVDDIATNNVLKQTVGGREIPKGESVDVFTTVDLQLGLSASDNSTFVPNVIGMRYHKAAGDIHASSLNVGKLYFDSTVRDYSDTLDAFVYRQIPAASENSCCKGTAVKLYLTIDQGKLPLPETDAVPEAPQGL